MKRISASVPVSTLLLSFVLASVSAAPLMAQGWPFFGGQNTANTGSAGGVSLSPQNVGTLKPRFVFTTGADVSARASVSGGVAYFPDWAGNLWAINSNNGQLKWSHQLSDYGLPAGTVSRATPTFSNGVIYVGTQFNACWTSGCPMGWLLAINGNNGQLLWKTQPDTSNSNPVITSAPVVANGVVYVGMTSNEEALAESPAYPCCSIRGSIVALNAATGAKLWQTFTSPVGYSGANVWGSNPVVDVSRKMVYVSTGDNYSHPAPSAPSAIPGETFSQCLTDPNGGTEANCLSPDDHVDSIIALDMATGVVKWATRMVVWHQFYAVDGSDDWNVSCIIGPGTNCPSFPTGPDYDFGSAPNEITYQTNHGSKTIIGAGQKSGIYYALDPDTGAILWQTQVGPGSALGGMEWGSASDGTRIYVAIADYYGIPWAGGSAGGWAALDPATGNVLWTTPDPNGAVDLAPLAVANGVVYAASMAGSATGPNMFALNAATGNILWSFAAGSSVIAGASPVNNDLYWGSGYLHLGVPGFTGNLTTGKFYAFTPNGT